MRRAIKLVATDLDGTLLCSDGTVSERSCRAIRSAQRQGIKIVLVTVSSAFSVQRNVPRHQLRGVCCCDWANLHKDRLDGCSGSIALCLKILAIKPQAKPTITSGFGQPKITEPSTLLEQIAAEKARGAPPMDKAKSFNALLVTEG